MQELIPHNVYRSTADDFDAAIGVLGRGWVAPGPMIEAFEDELYARFQRPACVVSSGTAAAYIALRLYADPGETIFLPTYSCFALLHAADGYGVELAECDLTTFNVERATIGVHTYGVPFDSAHCPIEDITHAIGATVNGRPVGTLARLAICSVGPTKLLSSPGGGFILGDSDAIGEARRLRDRLNLTMSDLHAAIARERLKRLDEELNQRIETAILYDKANPDLERHGERAFDSDKFSFYRYVIRVKDWRQAQAHFRVHGVQTINPLEPHELLHCQMGLSRKDFPHAEEVAATTLSLPIWPGMTAEQRTRVADALSELEG